MKLGVYVYVCVYTLTMARSGKRSQADTRRSSGKLTDMLCCCFLVPRRPRRPTSAHHDPPLTRIVGNDDGEEEEEEEDEEEDDKGDQKSQRPPECRSESPRMPLEIFLKASWGVLGASWRSWGPLGASWGASGEPLG